MRALRVSPLMRRASPLNYDTGAALDGTSKEITLGPIGLPSGLENRGNTMLGRRTPTASGSPSSQKTGSCAGPAVGTVSTLPAASTPTRKGMKATESANIQTQSDASDADWAHAQLQQMWDEGELSPRAPLDRSLGYFSSASPVSVGRSQPGTAADKGGVEDSPAQKPDRSEQCLRAPLFINNVRALWQMAPFSSTEEQVLTRSQRRRSSANLLQQLVAAQPRESAETLLQKQNQADEQRAENILTNHAEQCVASGSARQEQQQRLNEQLQSTRVLKPLDMTSAASAVTCEAGSRKRRASSPLASRCTSALSTTETLKGVGQRITTELSRAKGRRRLSPASAAAEKAAIAKTALGPSQSSPERGPTSVIEVASSSSIVEQDNSSHSSNSRIESPFQKLPPPSPSDLPVASPLPGSSPVNTNCRSPRLTATKQLKQGRITTISGQRPAGASTGAKHARPRPESPLRTSPRLSRGSRASACPTFRTPGGPCDPVHTSEAAGSSLPQRKDHCSSTSALAKAFSCTRGRRATQQQCSGNVGFAVTTGPPYAAPPAHELIAAPREVEQQKPYGGSFATSQTASDAGAAKDKSACTQENRPSKAEMPRSDVTRAAGRTSPSVVGEENPSPARSGNFSSSQLKPGSSVAAPTASSAHRNQSRRRILMAGSPTVKVRLQATIYADCTLPDKNSNRRATKCSANAPSAIPAGGRRRSTSRRTCGLTVTTIPSVCEASSSDSQKTYAPSSPKVLRETTGGAGTQGAAHTPPRVPGVAVPSRRRPTAFTKSRPTRAAPTQPSVPSNPSAERASGAKTADATSARAKNCGSEAPQNAAVASEKRDFSALKTARRRPGPESAYRLSPARGLGGSNSNLQQRRTKALTTPRKVRAPPINKARAETLAKGMKVNDGCTAAKSRVSASRQALEMPRCLFLGSTLTRSSRKSSATPTAAVTRRSALVQGASKRREKPSMQHSKDADSNRSGLAHESSATANVCQAEVKVAESVKDSVSLPEDSLNHAERLAASTGSKAASENPTHSRANLHANDESSRRDACNSSSSCTSNSCVSGDSQGAPSPLDASSHFTDVEGTCTSARRDCHSKSLSQGRRRSSSPHSISLLKGAIAENQQVEGSSRSMRRASSECSLSSGLQCRLSEQQQCDALEEWEGRDRDYQEKQQNLLLEQQKKERLLAWEQREAELLRNRKALSQEEPSFWGFDPFMVDEEDEGVLSTEELRVEVSRFLKGDLRFHSRADLLRVVKKFSKQTRTTTTTTSSRLNFAKVEQRVVPMAARQVHGPVPQERRRKSILRSSNGASQSECRRRSRGISFSPFNKVQLYMLDENERASKEAAANLSQQGEQRQQLRQRLAEQFQLMLLRGDSDSELALLRRELAELYDPDEEEDLAFLSPTLAPDRGADEGKQGTSPGLSPEKQAEGLKSKNIDTAEPFVAAGTEAGSRLPFTVSPSWRQRQHGSSEETLGSSKAEPSAEWTPPLSPFEPNRFNKSGEKENEDSWGTYLETRECAQGGELVQGASGNDENANCNAAGVIPSHSRAEEEKTQRPSRGVSNEDACRIHGKEMARRPSVLSRRLSIVPNVHSSCLRHPSLDVVLTPH